MAVDEPGAARHDPRVLGEAVRDEVVKAGINPAELSRRLGVSESTVSRLIGGEVQDVTVDRIVQIERALGVPAGRVFRRAGLVTPEDGETVRDKLLADPSLTAEELLFVLRVYDAAVEASAEARSPSSPKTAPRVRSTRRR